MWTEILLAVIGLCSGMLVSGGVFTVLIAVGLMPRFAGKTHTADKVFLYEEMVIWGTIIGGVLSIFSPRFGNLGLPGIIIIGVFGLFAGVFVGCLALAIAEMLDTIPIFARRIGFRHGLGIVVVAMAIGKMIGSALYFIYEFSQ
ncbi:MAG TPA: stage V sporulation protein AB [Lachnospiraceae bacterium]|nr:stage V sporulation protein AB [Lachnospiraceae bacterium]